MNNEKAKTEIASSLIAWKGFGNQFQPSGKKETPPPVVPFTPIQAGGGETISPSQAGILRRFLSPKADKASLAKWVANVIKKNRQGKFSIPEAVLKEIQRRLNEPDIHSSQQYIRDYLNTQRQLRWDGQKASLKEKLVKEKKLPGTPGKGGAQ